MGNGEEPSERVVEQRIRNRVMDYLALAASYLAQQEYERTVPIAHIPYEVINQWEDQFPRGLEWELERASVYTSREAEALRRFEGVWKATTDAVPDDYPSLRAVQALPAWQELQTAAASALDILEQRGRMPEDREVP